MLSPPNLFGFGRRGPDSVYVSGHTYQCYSGVLSCEPQVCEVKLSKLTVHAENMNGFSKQVG